MRRRLLLALALLVTLAPLATAEAGVTRTVSATDPTCGGASPCSTTIQAAITTAQAGDTIRIRPGTQSNTMIRLKDKGVPFLNRHSRGDHYARIVVEIPERLTSRQRELMEEFKSQ